MITPAKMPILIRQCCRVVILMALFGTLVATLACIDGFPQSILPGREERDVGEVTVVRTEPAPTSTKPFAASAPTEPAPTEPAPTEACADEACADEACADEACADEDGSSYSVSYDGTANRYAGI